ncbi:LuxR family transcriptional regulator [Intrasporangium mesophilum]
MGGVTCRTRIEEDGTAYPPWAGRSADLLTRRGPLTDTVSYAVAARGHPDDAVQRHRGVDPVAQRAGPLWGEALSAHRTILRDVFARFDGIEINTEGDSFFVVFTSATNGLRAAVDAQRGLADHEWPMGMPVRVRMGLHTGEPQRHEDDYVGIDVHLAARISAAAHGGQIVISDPTHALVGDTVQRVTVRDLGWHRLKDIPRPQHLYDVTAPGLLADHPPLRSLGMAANLPAYTGELVGRASDLDDLVALIDRGARLVTLTGPGGTGKTRLAVSVARALEGRFPHGVFFVPLHTADRAALMWAAIAEVVGATGNAEQQPRDRATEFVRDRDPLLVLDNLEQIPDASQVVSQLLEGGHGVSVLATSRRPLHLVEEQLYPLTALAVPAARGGSANVADVARVPAVQLFVQRAGLVRPGFALTADNADDVVALCRRLDGLPLAIELAAARCRLLAPRALLSRIDSWLGETAAAPEGQDRPDRPERQRTLRGTIAWSYDMLPEEDQRAFRRFGAFSSPVGLDAVEEVVCEGGDPLDVVTRLVDVSLLEISEGHDGEPLVHMLETIRRFSREQMESCGETDEVRLRHARWCLRVTSEIAATLHGPRQMTALDQMEAVIEDVRASMDWSFDLAGQSDDERFTAGLALLAPMDSYWYRFGYIQEGRGWHQRALALVDSGNHGDSAGLVNALHGHGILALQQNDVPTGTQALERALAIAHRLGDVSLEARECNSLGIARREGGDPAGSRELIERSLDLARQAGDPRREATALSNLVHGYMDTGDYGPAVDAARRALAADQALDDPWGVAIDRCNLVTALLHAEGPEQAFREFVDVAPAAVALGDVELSIDVVEILVSIWAAFGDAARAANLLGVAERQRDITGISRSAPDQVLLDRFVAPLQAATDSEHWHEAYTRGLSLTIEAAVAAYTSGHDPTRAQARFPDAT